MRAEIVVTGIVQGIGFRPFIYRVASRNGLVGFVRNRGDGCVEIVVEGKEEKIQWFIQAITKEASALTQIHSLNTTYGEDKNEFKDFRIFGSFEARSISGSVIPPDISICDKCLEELQDPENMRYNYFFITCTECGPRYTVINRLPYDRVNITMIDFPMCEACEKEYTEPLNRRFHAQTIACNICGPKVFLTTSNGECLECNDPTKEAGRLLEEGFIVAVKGNGGFHIATSTLKSEPIIKLRKVKHRAQKPFAIMAQSLETIKTFAKVSRSEAELLTSYIKPIVLLEKNEGHYLSEEISPGLHNIGVMLPYTGLHHILFYDVKEPAFVMTSANQPSEPIIKENEEAIKKLGSTVNYFLLHNRKIAQRCDDSVVRFNGRNQCIIRRSRGYTPTPIHLKHHSEKCVMGVGAEENVTGCIIEGDRAFLTQYVVGIVCDGFGYGLDGKAWGGEIMCYNGKGFDRLGHLQEQPLVGGDRAVIYPLRMAAGILRGVPQFEDWLLQKANHFPYGRQEVELIFNQLRRGEISYTTSCGRVLDAVSALLGICYERTYEGEPAIKLESRAVNGRDILELEPLIEGETINTTYLLIHILENLGKHSVADLAYSAQTYIAKSLAQLAVEKAEDLDVKAIVFSGGVAYNKQITLTIMETLEKNGFRFITNNQIPQGDGGISFGQAYSIHLTST